MTFEEGKCYRNIDEDGVEMKIVSESAKTSTWGECYIAEVCDEELEETCLVPLTDEEYDDWEEMPVEDFEENFED